MKHFILQDSKDIQELNVHSVIYDHALKDVYNMDSIEAIESVWNCLYFCLDHFVDLDAFTVCTLKLTLVTKHKYDGNFSGTNATTCWNASFRT